jgi:FkbM family methyltransferase
MKGGLFNTYINKPYSTLKVYEEIFLNHEHRRAPGFKNAKHLLLDIGANMGMYTVAMCSADTNLRVVCVEPNPQTYDLLVRNIHSNHLDDRVTAINKACWVEDTSLQLLSLPSNNSNASVEQYASLNSWLSTPLAQKETVKSVTLREILSELDSSVDILKVDTEGSEFEILKGAGNYLSVIKRIVVEYHSIGLRNDVLNLLIEQGFSLELETQDPPNNITTFGNVYVSRLKPHAVEN